MVTPEASIVIVSHRENSISACLEGFTEAIVSGVSMETVVVADYPVERLSKKYPSIQWIYHNDASIPKKRNIGIREAQAPVVGFIDDDCVPLDNWIGSAVRYLRDNPNDAGVAGRTIIEQCNGVSYPIREFRRLERPSFRTNNIFYRKDVLQQVGGFDERFSKQREDIDLAFSILRRGRSIGYCAECTVLHRHRGGERWDLLKNCVNRRFDPLLLKKHAKLYRTIIGTPFTPSIACVLAMHCLVVIGFLYGGAVCAAACAFLDAGCSFAAGWRRKGECRTDMAQVICDWFSYCIAPFVLVAALVYGSVKYGKLLVY